MDFTSDFTHLIPPNKLRAYESILDEIRRECERTKKLENEIERESTRSIIHNLSIASSVTHKMAHINVKIFSDLSELLHLYRDEIKRDLSKFFKLENCKFCLIELYIVGPLYKKLAGQDFYINISAKFENTGSTSSVSLPLNNYCMPILEIIPINENAVNFLVEVDVFATGDSYVSARLGSVSVDISYHFEMYKKGKVLSIDRQALEIFSMYNTTYDFLELRKPLWTEYHFLTNINSKEFIKMFIQNCYHKVNLECFSELGNDSKNLFLLKFSTGFDKHSITYDTESKIITLKSNVKSLADLKKYFCKKSFAGAGDMDKIGRNASELLLSAGRCENKEELCSLYFTLRKFWTKSYE